MEFLPAELEEIPKMSPSKSFSLHMGKLRKRICQAISSLHAMCDYSPNFFQPPG